MMRSRLFGLTAVVVTLLTIAPQAQEKPNFAGVWKVVPEKTHSGGNGGCPPGARDLRQEFKASQSSSALTVERIEFRSLATFTYKIDGSESKNTVSGGESLSKVSWNGDKLTISTSSVFDTGGGDVATVTMKSTQVLTIEPNGLLSVV